MSFGERLQEIRTGFDRPFWVANISELFERLSYYAAFASLARYLHETLSFPTEQAATLTGFFGDWCGFWRPSAGALADRLGFRRSLYRWLTSFFSSPISCSARSARGGLSRVRRVCRSWHLVLSS